MEPHLSERTTIHEVRGGGGLRLHVREWGDPAGPALLFVHGWTQSHLCWSQQACGPLAADFRVVAFDCRGHGMSDKPTGAEHYADGRLWADDVAAVIEQTGLQRPVLVAWSYGGCVVTDYLRAYGDEQIAGIDLAGAAVLLGPAAFAHFGPEFLGNVQDACAPDLATRIAAMRRILRACTAQPVPADDLAAALAVSMVVPLEIKGALLAREIDADDVLAGLSVPVLVTHGTADGIVLRSMAEHVLEVCPTARPSWYAGAGHMPFVEDAARFDRELAAFAGAPG